MTLVDCPLCDHPVPFDLVEDVLDCADCGPLDLAPDEATLLALAA